MQLYGTSMSHHILIHPSRNVIIHRLYEIVNILLPAIISEGGIPLKGHDGKEEKFERE